jgi:uncharacterized protein
MHMPPAQFEAVRRHAIQSFRVGPNSIHGLHHWRTVEKHGLLIAPEVGADVQTVQLFAILHDCCRLDDESDLEHGPRAARMVRTLAGSLITLDPARLDTLVHAIHHHTDGTTSDDPTIGTCWDADRLDLGRVGIIPSASLMSTTAGKRIAELGSSYMYRQERGQP